MAYAYYSNTTKGFYVTELGYAGYPEDIIEITKEQHLHLLDELNGNNKVIIIQNGKIELIERPAQTIDWNNVRFRRNSLLTQSDHTQLPDFPALKKEEWATYRQLLRDIPQTYATPEEVIWPTPPT